MRKKELDAVFNMIFDDTVNRNICNPLIDEIHLLYPDMYKLVPIVDLETKTDKGVFFQYYRMLEKTKEFDGISYADAISDLHQEYHNLMRNYVTQGKMYELGLYAVRFCELRALVDLSSAYQTVCLWLSKESIGYKDNIVVVSNGNIYASDFNGNLRDLPRDNEFVFLIDMTVYKRVLDCEKAHYVLTGFHKLFS